MSKLIIHIGPHKTGSTAIQTLLQAQQSKLRASGFFYETFSSFPGGVHHLADLISANGIDQLPADFFKIFKISDNIIVSSENFSRLKKNQVEDLIYRLNCSEIKVVYFLRNPLHRMMSLWQEKVKHGYRYTFLEYLAARLATPYKSDDLNAALHLESWGEVVGYSNLNIHLYDRLPDAASLFLNKYCDLPISETKKIRNNVSLDYVRIELYRALTGYQWHLNFENTFENEIRIMCEKIKTKKNKNEETYDEKFSLSLDNAILHSIEQNLINKFCFIEPFKDNLFKKRSTEYHFIRHSIWLENPDLTTRLFELRHDIHKKCGLPQFDKRLRQI